ncbi:MAG: hypothetical protein ACLQG3_04885 [Terracidiphilus sp.]
MPLKWEQGKKSPYTCNCFSVLRVGPNTRRREISQTSQEILKEIESGNKVLCACGHEVDVHQVGHATSQLLEANSLAEELLLIHPQPPRDNKDKVNALVDNLNQAAVLPLKRDPIPLRHAAAFFWFTPAPGPEAVELPAWDELGLVKAGDPEDLALDIVFES